MFSTVIERLNDRRDDAGDTGEDAGFTLIELMVVLLILAILLAIAIPTFLGVTKSANDRAAESNLNTALVNAKAAYQSQGQSYTNSSVTNSTQFAAALQTAELSLTFGTTNSATQGNISVMVSSDGNGIVLAAFSKSSNNCWYIIDNPVSPTTTSNAPWGATPTSTNGVTTTAAVSPIVFSAAQQGTIYAEVKGSTAAQCSASTPVTPGGATTGGYQWSTAGFPTL